MHRLQHFALLGTYRFGVETGRWLHRGQLEQLKQVIGHHVTQRAGGIIKSSPRPDAKRLRDGDLHMINVVAIPQRLEDAVAEPKDHDVLHRLLAEIMVDAEYLLLRHGGEEQAIELPRRA